MEFNEFFNKEKISELLTELSQKFNIDENEVNECIVTSLAKAYKYERITFNADGSITGVKKTDKNSFTLIHHNISRKIYKQFEKILHNEFYNKSFLKIEKRFDKLILESHNIFFGKCYENNDNNVVFELYDSNNTKLKNFYAVLNLDKNKIFSNEFNNGLYNQKEKGLLLYIPKREKISQVNGKFYIKSIRRHPDIIRFLLNNIFKDIKSKLGGTYSYNKCFINLRLKKITLFTNVSFSDVVREFINKRLSILEDFEVTYINAKRDIKK